MGIDPKLLSIILLGVVFVLIVVAVNLRVAERDRTLSPEDRKREDEAARNLGKIW